MSSEFKNIKGFDAGGQDLTVNPINVGVFGDTAIPHVVMFQIGNSRATISLEDFCDMF